MIQSLTIPRAVCVLAGGTFPGVPDPARGLVLEVAARLGDPSWGIIQSPYMRDRASTREFRHTLTLQGKRLSYRETTVLDIYGRSFDHTDENELVRSSRAAVGPSPGAARLVGVDRRYPFGGPRG